jgi:hypothetical protein
MASKSANYVYASRAANEGFMLLCEAALGRPHRLTHAHFVTTLPKHRHSTHGVGATSPCCPQPAYLEDEIAVPVGAPGPNTMLQAALARPARAKARRARMKLEAKLQRATARVTRSVADEAQREEQLAELRAAHVESLARVSARLEKEVAAAVGKGGALLYDEYMVYSEDQVRIRFLVNVRFIYE